MEVSSKGAGNGGRICLGFPVERLEVVVSGVASYFPECSTIELHFFVVDGFCCGICCSQHFDEYF